MHILWLMLAFWAPQTATSNAEVAESSVLSALATHSLLLDIVHAGGRRLIAVGERGHILVSTDCGQMFNQVHVPTRTTLTAVHFPDTTHGWAVGHDAIILHTADGGIHWELQSQDPALEAPLLSVWFEDQNHGFAVGGFGLLVETTDGGLHWNKRTLDAEVDMHIYAIRQIAKHTWILAGEGGMVYLSEDNGNSWQRQNTDYMGAFFGIQINASDQLVLYGMRGHVYLSSDLGHVWTHAETRTSAALEGGANLANGTLLLVGQGGQFLSLTKDGAKGERQPRLRSLAGVAECDGRLVLVGESGITRPKP